LPVRAPWLESAIPIATSAGLEVHVMWCMPCLLDDVINSIRLRQRQRERRVGRRQTGPSTTTSFSTRPTELRSSFATPCASSRHSRSHRHYHRLHPSSDAFSRATSGRSTASCRTGLPAVRLRLQNWEDLQEQIQHRPDRVEGSTNRDWLEYASTPSSISSIHCACGEGRRRRLQPRCFPDRAGAHDGATGLGRFQPTQNPMRTTRSTRKGRSGLAVPLRRANSQITRAQRHVRVADDRRRVHAHD
jgi:hypothetical protein